MAAIEIPDDSSDERRKDEAQPIRPIGQPMMTVPMMQPPIAVPTVPPPGAPRPAIAPASQPAESRIARMPQPQPEQPAMPVIGGGQPGLSSALRDRAAMSTPEAATISRNEPTTSIRAAGASPTNQAPQPPAVSLPPERKAAVEKLMDKARGIQNPFARILAEIGTGALRTGEGIAEGTFPGIAAMVPGGILNTALANKREVERAKTQSAMQETEARTKALSVPPIEWKTTGQPVTDDAGNVWVTQENSRTGEARLAPAMPTVPGGSPAQPIPQTATQPGTAMPIVGQDAAQPAMRSATGGSAMATASTAPANGPTFKKLGATPSKPTAEGDQLRLAQLQQKQDSGQQLTPAEQNEFDTLQREQTIARPNDAPIGKETDDYNQKISDALKGTGIDPKPYQVNAKTLRGAANQNLTEAQHAAQEHRSEQNALRVANAPTDAEARKDARTMGYAVDESGNLKYMSKADADKIHSTFEEMKPADVTKDRQALRQLDDVQLNSSRYRKAMNALPSTGIPADHVQAMAHILTDIENEKSFVLSTLTLGSLGSILGQGERAKDWNKLTSQEQDVLSGYLRAKGSVIAYTKALTGIGRTNKETMEIEMNNLPVPFVGATVANPRLDAWQENIDQATQGFPVNLPGIKSPKQVREESEGKKSGGFKDF